MNIPFSPKITCQTEGDYKKEVNTRLLVEELINMYEAGGDDEEMNALYRATSIDAMRGHSFLLKEIRGGLNKALKSAGLKIINYEIPQGGALWENDLQIEIVKI